MIIQMSKVREPVSEQQLADIETELGIRLPREYKEFISKYNGGRPRPGGFVIQSGAHEDRSLVDFFFSFTPGDLYDIVKYHKRLKGRIPSDLLPIAIDPFGNIICLSVSGATEGKVFFWDHEKEPEENSPPSYDNVYLIADNFESFINSLTDFSD